MFIKVIVFENQKQPPEVFCKKGVLRNFAKFPGIYLCQSLFQKRVSFARVSFQNLKKRLWHRRFPGNFAKFLRTPFLQNTSGRLLLENKTRKVYLHVDYNLFINFKIGFLKCQFHDFS